MTDELLNKPYWIIDILPTQVPADSPGKYFAVEGYFLRNQLAEIKRKHIHVILKLNCYRKLTVEGEDNPPPERIAEIMNTRYVLIGAGDAVILSEPDDTHMTLFGPDVDLLELVKVLCAGEGLYVWQPPQQ